MFFPYRDDNPPHRFPVVTLCLILINTAIHIYQSLLSPERVRLFIASTGAIPFEIMHLIDVVQFPDHPAALVPIPLTLLSSMFVHGGWLHLISNMWYLWIFGDNIEDVMGRVRYLVFYLTTGVMAAMAQILIDPQSLIPTVGASGAIAGVLGAYAMRFPRARVHCFIFIFIIVTTVQVSAKFVLGSWFVMQLVNGAIEKTLGGVAWFAHIGGFVAGVALVFLFTKRGSRR